MKTEQITWSKNKGWDKTEEQLKLKESANVIFVFGSRSCLESKELVDRISEFYPTAIRLGCTTAGEIYGTQVQDESLVITAVEFEHTQVRSTEFIINQASDSAKAGESIAKALLSDDLKYVFVLSEGLLINGSELVKGLSANLPPHVAISGGLAGDGSLFKKTMVYLNDTTSSGRVAAIGFYGDHLKICAYASMGGWDAYGLIRRVTKSENNLLMELDGKPALDVYKDYLGDAANELPIGALLYPLSMRREQNDTPLVRTVLGIDNDKKTITFAGDVPVGSHVQFMKINFTRLVDAVSQTADKVHEALEFKTPDLAILISCVGRKLVLKQQIEDETEAVQEGIGEATMAGMYCYGEISPFSTITNTKCELHNQTLAITTFVEK